MRANPLDAARLYLHGLATLHLGKAVSNDEVEWLLRLSPPVEYRRGQVVFHQGEPADTALLVVRGKLSALVVNEAGGARTVGEAGAWDVVGETALYAPDSPRSATVRAVRDSTCLIIGHGQLAEGRHNPVISAIEYHLLHTLSQRIRATSRVMQDVLREVGEASLDMDSP